MLRRIKEFLKSEFSLLKFSFSEILHFCIAMLGIAVWLLTEHVDICGGIFHLYGMLRFCTLRLPIWCVGLFFARCLIVRGGKSPEYGLFHMLLLNALLFIPGVNEKVPSLVSMVRVILPWTAALIFAASAVSSALGGQNASRLTQGKRTGLALYLILAVFYCVCGFDMYNAKGMKAGDEIHYVMQARSLLEDGDLDLTNNIRAHHPSFAHDYVSFKRSHISMVSHEGKAYSYHPMGISLLMVPAMYIAGEPGCVLFICIISALMGPLLFVSLKTYCRDCTAAVMTLLFTVPLPFCIYAGRPYPEFFTSLCIMYAFWVLTRDKQNSLLSYAAAGVMLGLTIWLLPRRCMLQIAGLCIAAVLRMKKDGGMAGAAAFFIPLGLIAAGHYATASYMFSGPNVAEAAGVRTDWFVAGSSFYSGSVFSTDLRRFLPMLAILIDTYGGIIWTNAFMTLMVPATLMIIRRSNLRMLALPMFLFWSQYLLVGAGNVCGWQAGTCHPPRYLFPVLFYLAFPAAVLCERYGNIIVRQSTDPEKCPAVPGGVSVLLAITSTSLISLLSIPFRFDTPYKAFWILCNDIVNLSHVLPVFVSSKYLPGNPLNYPHIFAALAALVFVSYLFFVSRKGMKLRPSAAFSVLIAVSAVLDMLFVNPAL